MKYLQLACLVTVVGALAGCPATPQELLQAQNLTQASLTNPTIVGTLPDGRMLYRVVVVNADDRDHTVYFINKADVTLNRNITEGKTTRNVVTPSMEGSDEAVLAKADEIRKAREQAERAELERLKTIYER